MLSSNPASNCLLLMQKSLDPQHLICFSFELVESIPTGLEFPGGVIHKSTFDAWIDLLMNAKESIGKYVRRLNNLRTCNFSDIVAFYWSLLDKTGIFVMWSRWTDLLSISFQVMKRLGKSVGFLNFLF
jgi:hypothetical protein